MKWPQFRRHSDFVIERGARGRSLVVTGPWSRRTERVLDAGLVDSLVLNYARGFQERTLDFIKPWPLRGVLLLQRTQYDIEPLYRMASTLEWLLIEPHDTVRLDLSKFPKLCDVFSPWTTVAESISQARGLEELSVLHYRAQDLTPLTGLTSLQWVRFNGATKLESLAGASGLPGLRTLWIQSAPRLVDLTELSTRADTLTVLELESCKLVANLDFVTDCTRLRALGINDSGAIDSLRPIRGLKQLEAFEGWGSTRFTDGDLTPLTELPLLYDVRVNPRKHYRPTVDEIDELIGPRKPTTPPNLLWS